MKQIKPVGIQRKRTKGWKMPPNTVYVGRPSKWGNPYDWRDYAKEFDSRYSDEKEEWSKRQAMESFDLDIRRDDEASHILLKFKVEEIEELRGKNLACWCKVGDPCHRNVLLKYANQ